MKNNTSVPKMLKLNVLTLKHFMFFFLKRGETHIKTDISTKYFAFDKLAV